MLFDWRVEDELSELEQRWVDYARKVLEDTAHHQECRDRGGSPEDAFLDPGATLDPDLRWPGYLGRRYSWRGVLCVATVHRDFDSNGAGPQVRADIVDGTRGLAEGSLTGGQYLEIVRRGYEAGLGRWVVGSNLGGALSLLDMPIDAIAYVNAARCQFPEDFGHLELNLREQAKATGRKVKRSLVKLCLAQFPVSDLIDLLDPSVVIFASMPAYESALTTLSRAPHVLPVCIHPFLTRGKAPLQRPLRIGEREFPRGTQAAEWAPVLRDHLEAMRSRS